jgi:hypothetical protein
MAALAARLERRLAVHRPSGRPVVTALLWQSRILTDHRAGAAPPGQIGEVFGFVSSGMSLGGAIMPVFYGMIIDTGRTELVLVSVTTLLLLGLLCAGARVGFRHPLVPAE